MYSLKFKRIASISLAVVCTGLLATVYGSTRTMATRHASVTGGLIHWWKFDGNGSDSIGDLNVTPIGPVSYEPAVMGDGIVFNGSSTGICLPPTLDLQFQWSFSMSVWANLRSYPSSGQMWSSIIFNGDDRPGLDPYALQVGPDKKLVFLVTGAHGEGTITTPMPLNKFVLITATYDKPTGVQSLYINGKLIGQNSGKTELTPVVALVEGQNAGIGIGTNNYFQKSRYHFGWNGVIDDLRIYNRAISPADVQTLYKMGAAAADAYNAG